MYVLEREGGEIYRQRRIERYSERWRETERGTGRKNKEREREKRRTKINENDRVKPRE